MQPYFICSLPRSRTAWLANFLTHEDSFCFHEPMNLVSLENYPSLLSTTGREYAGISDSLNVLIVDKLLEMFPEAKLVAIRRPVDEVDQSLQRLGFPCKSLLNKMERELERVIREYDPLVIEFNDFSAEDIWSYLLPDQPLDKDRMDMLEDFNITVSAEVIMKKGCELMVTAGDLLWPLIR
jgi:hypothetical protein